ncbi:protein-glutamate methylesterase/protein-glutamine glutaminase [Lapillicoccus jejuensis]|uniref:Protein-glutamate methylesterase/protein-glutamine glutaminase n=1 Tax=Lapillicoccus jejuensis TaxID=402171 RepID=A0A542E198_9MICO|nr:chemotaxis response regulator protein-glutamate methylesterase [Lapillicoccus jejuensis]TQJ09116.1 two-component system chemotaxis response regulator CheB [Lapillicoccus jejuensis]
MPPIRVLVVDDSVVVRRLVANALSGDPDIEVVGTAANGRIALTKIEALRPQAITLDIEMPVMNGIETVRALRRLGHRMPVVMFSTLTERGATATLDALEAGANDYVTKPANVGSISESLEQVRSSLIPKLKALCARPERRFAAGRPVVPDALRPGSPRPGEGSPGRSETVAGTAPRRASDSPYRILAIGCSTGGPEALGKVLAGLPRDLAVPVVVVQHMPPVFTAQFAARLDRALPLTVVEAREGMPLRPGHVYIAPGDHHLRLAGTRAAVRTALDQGPQENFCRPAVDVLFRSVVALYGRDVLAAVLTGMGQDGRAGSVDIVKAGGSVIAQDEATSVVWGMPGSVVQAGAAEEIVPLGLIGPTLARRLAGSATAGATAGTAPYAAAVPR